jgi:hypothetical protein
MRLGLGVSIPGTSSLVQAAFSPLDLSPVLWLDASDTSTITEVGGAVSQWDNKGSLGDFTQGTAALQPTSGTETLNSLNVIDFDGTEWIGASTAADWAFLHDGTNCLIAAVINSDTAIGNQIVMSTQASSGNPGFYYGHVTSNKVHLVQNAVSNTMEASQIGAYILTLLADPDNGTAADRSLAFVDDGTVIQNNTTATGATSPNADPLKIGVRGSTVFWKGTVAEIVIVTGANATESNRQALRDYLNNKWAVY